MFNATDDKESWPKYILWSAALALATGVATKLGETIVEECKKRIEATRGAK